jgi:tetratricopeptide (TPR) repeat protein
MNMKPFFVALTCLFAALPAAAQDPLTAARELYASAAYEEALSALSRLQSAGTTPAVLEQADQYRAFCLFALGRTSDAQTVAENLIRKNPTLELDTTDASPRITEMFTSVRRRLLPDLVRERYRTARGAIDRKDYATAEPQLAEVRQMLDEAEKMKVVDEGLADLRVLVDGFLDLARTLQATEQAAQRAAIEKAEAAPSAAPATGQTARPAGAVNQAAAPAASTVFDQSAPDVVAPVALLQEVPAVPPSLMPMFRTGQTAGMLDVLIDESGNVERSAIRQSMNPAYDAIVLRASKEWRYRPARRGQMPMKYLKTITIVVQK